MEIDRLYDLRDDLDRSAQLLEAAGRSTSRGYEGSDGTGSVTVRLTPEGRLDDVRVGMAWRDAVGPAGLAGAVLGAIQAAGVARLEEWGTAMDAVLSGRAPQLRPAPDLYQTLAGRLEGHVRPSRTPHEARAAEAELVAVMDELIASVDELSAQVDAVTTATSRGRSDHSGHVVADVTAAGDVTALEYDERWLERAHPANIGRETLAAVDDALRSTAGRSVGDVVAGSRLQELTDLLNDPAAVTVRLGL